MITHISYNAKALQLNGSPNNSPRSTSAEDQRMPVAIRRRLRSIIASPGWRLAALISTMLFVGSFASSAADVILVEHAENDEFNGIYYPRDTGMPAWADRIGIHDETGWKNFIDTKRWYESTSKRVIYFRDPCWNLHDSEECAYNTEPITSSDSESAKRVPPMKGWKGFGAPTLRSLSFVSQQLALRNMLKKEASDLHSMQREDWIESGIPPGELDELLAWLKLNPDRRRRLATEAVGYGPHDHASTRCHIHRLLASEAAAAGSAC